jgi:3-hydroxyacyl-[acyl-carrier-protein] dehydratase
MMDIQKIKTYLPHRYPFLMVDRILEISATKVVGIKNISVNEPFFQGHFPTRPVMPGVLVIEALAQLGGCVVLADPKNAGKMVYLIGVDGFRFRKVAVPGDQLRLEAEMGRTKANFGTMKGQATIDGEEVCSGEIMYSLVDAG